MSDIPAGWQPDPRGRHEYRYWDGTQWTDHVSDQGQVSSDPVADASPPADSEKSAIFKPDASPASAAGAEPTEVQPAAGDGGGATEMPTESAGGPASSQPTAAEPVAHEPAAASPEPVGAGSYSSASSAPPGGETAPATAQTDAKAAAKDMLHSRSPELATILTAVVPGTGHLYMGTDKVPLAAGLIVATIAAVIISHMSFVMFLIGFAIWVGAVVFGLKDLRGGVRGIEETSLPKNMVGILLIGAGALLVISLLLPWYRVSAEVSGFGVSQSQSISGNAFEVFGIEDIILLIVGIGSIVAGAASLGLGPVTSAELPRQLPLAVAIGGAIATLIILLRMFFDSAPGVPGNLDGSGIKASIDVGRAFGMWIGLWASMVLLIANAGILRSLADKKR